MGILDSFDKLNKKINDFNINLDFQAVSIQYRPNNSGTIIFDLFIYEGPWNKIFYKRLNKLTDIDILVKFIQAFKNDFNLLYDDGIVIFYGNYRAVVFNDKFDIWENSNKILTKKIICK